jgi:hypothetical protein
MQAPLLSGIVGGAQGEFRLSYPRNLEPVVIDSKISKGQLRATAGATSFGAGPGNDRGGILWNDQCFRVMGSKLVLVKAGTSVVVTELADPFSILPLKYGSAEQDPDAVTGLAKVRGELYVFGSYTIEVHQLVGGAGFPFQVVPGATIPFGCVAARAKAYFAESVAFVGGARDAALGVYIAGGGTATKISSRTVDDALASVTDPTSIEVETRSYRDEERLFVHLPDRSFVFMRAAAELAGDKIWYEAGSGRDDAYRPINAVNAYGKTIVGDRSGPALGLLDEGVADHFGEIAEWGFDCGLIYNAGKGGILNEIELSGLPGRAPFGDETTVFLSFTEDGERWSVEKGKSLGQSGDTRRKVRWRPGREFRNWIGMRFRGHGRALPGFAACEVTAEPLSV